jgi:hypothetical protein
MNCRILDERIAEENILIRITLLLRGKDAHFPSMPVPLSKIFVFQVIEDQRACKYVIPGGIF